jgi:hypothetical protein
MVRRCGLLQLGEERLIGRLAVLVCQRAKECRVGIDFKPAAERETSETRLQAWS